MNTTNVELVQAWSDAGVDVVPGESRRRPSQRQSPLVDSTPRHHSTGLQPGPPPCSCSSGVVSQRSIELRRFSPRMTSCARPIASGSGQPSTPAYFSVGAASLTSRSGCRSSQSPPFGSGAADASSAGDAHRGQADAGRGSRPALVPPARSSAPGIPFGGWFDLRLIVAGGEAALARQADCCSRRVASKRLPRRPTPSGQAITRGLLARGPQCASCWCWYFIRVYLVLHSATGSTSSSS